MLLGDDIIMLLNNYILLFIMVNIFGVYILFNSISLCYCKVR